jgi:dTDP-4-dehydrorhamnose reductase
MRLLVTGATGQLARSLAALDRSQSDLLVVALGRPDLDIENPGSIAIAIDRIRPDVVVNAAAYTGVDAAEGDQARAFAINASAAGSIAHASAAVGVPLIHISTDYVFNGKSLSHYCEDDLPDPRTVYGRSKLAGEVAVAVANRDHVILRTAWMYSPWGTNFLRTMLRLARERDTIRVVDDQLGNPTYAPDLADAIVVIARRLLAEPEDHSLRGTFHAVGPERVSWCDFAFTIMNTSSTFGGPRARVVPIASTEYPTVAERPKNTSLDPGMIRRIFGIDLPPRSVSVGRCFVRMMLDGSVKTREKARSIDTIRADAIRSA